MWRNLRSHSYEIQNEWNCAHRHLWVMFLHGRIITPPCSKVFWDLFISWGMMKSGFQDFIFWEWSEISGEFPRMPTVPGHIFGREGLFFEKNKNKNKKLERSVGEKFLIHLRCSTNPIHFLLTHFSNHYAHWKKLLHILYINNILQLPGIVTHPRLDNYTNCGIYSLGSDNFPEPPPLSMLWLWGCSRPNSFSNEPLSVTVQQLENEK